MSPGDPRMALLALDRAVIVYLALTGGFSLIFGGWTGAAIAVAHAVGVGLVLLIGRRPLPGNRFLRFVRLTYGVAICPLFYAELATINRFLTERYFDSLVQGWESALFGTQLSIRLAEWWPSVLLSESLHLGYFAYYAIVPLALIGVYATRGEGALHRAALATAVAFFVCYLIFAVFPVAGPRYEFAAIAGAQSDGTLFQLVHRVLEGGSSRGTAFPSSHIAASAAAVLAAGREDRRWFWVLILPELALTLGTVYGRFHYGVDALAGAVTALAVVWSLGRWRGQPGSGPGYPSGGMNGQTLDSDA